MKVTFLSAAVRLSKTYEEIAPGNYHEESYPHVGKFSSLEYEVDSLSSFHAYMVACADEGMCLLKGNLDRQLVNESRAGHTNSSDPTMWVCLDVDYTVTDKSPDEWLEALDPVFSGVSYIFHYSAGQNIKTHNGWRGHFFLMLDEAVTPAALKQWLIHLNLHNKELKKNLELCASGAALKYPLDVTTCQNDKLLFIAPPTTVGFEVKGSRFELHNKTCEHLTLDIDHISAANNSNFTQEIIKEHRQQAGLPSKKIKTKFTDYGCDVLTNPDPVTVTGKREARGFVYLNLNGGDSWAYYFPADNPELLHNFKGEPAMYMRDVDKDLYVEYKKSPAEDTDAELVPFGFLCTDDDQYYRGFAERETGALHWVKPVGSTRKLRDFLVQNGVSVPTNEKDWVIDEWTVRFDPSEETAIDWTRRIVNTYKKSSYLVEAEKIEDATIPSTINKVLDSVCVRQDVKHYFLNWLAFIFQTRQKTGTAWIFQGVQGTGKGVLFQHILSPIIGYDYCHEMTMDRMNDDFNQYLERNILLFIDEAQTGDSKTGERILNRIKNLVTEPRQHIRGMRRNALVRDNYTNIILASNHDEIIRLESTDRRFNVAPRQETPIQLDYDDIVRIGAELSDFATYLNSYEVSDRAVRQVMLSAERQALVELSQTTLDKFFLAIRNGDLAYFTQFLTTSLTLDVEGLQYNDFSRIVLGWVFACDGPMNIPRDDLRIVYQFLQQAKVSPTKFSRMAGKYNLDIKPIRMGDNLVRGLLDHQWHIDDQEKAELLQTYKGKKLSVVKE